MPVRNVVKILTPQTFYHVYNRGHNRENLFNDKTDYQFFEFLLQRCFGPEQLKGKEGKLFPWFGAEVELAAYCLMPNHYHLLLYQKDSEMLAKAMQSLGTTYTMYFNAKYGRRGSAFESAYKASAIYDDSYLQHISRYIHLNPRDYASWQFSSYRDYMGNSRRWVAAERILEIFDSTKQYEEFVADYKSLHDELESLKHTLADSGESYNNI